MTLDQDASPNFVAMPSAHAKGGRLRAGVNALQPTRHSHLPLLMQALEASLERTLCQAHMRLAAGLARAGRLRPGGGPFNAESQRFEQRFSALHRLAHPEPLDYDQFASAVDATGGQAHSPCAPCW